LNQETGSTYRVTAAYEPLTGSVTFAANQTSATIELSVIDDAVGENDESLSLYLA
jgi:hypothetical protein